jgi:hypothetical protein
MSIFARAAGVAAVCLASVGLLAPAAVADHEGFPSNQCVAPDGPEYREDVQDLVDAFYDVGTNPFHFDNDGNGIACDNGADFIDNDPSARQAPFGNLDGVTAAGPGRIRVVGWSVDPDVPSWPTPVHVYVDGRAAAVVPRAEAERPDVEQVLGIADTGFDTTFAASPGTHTVCAYAINYGPLSPNTTLGCRSVKVLANSPVGSFDTLHFFADGSPVVYGWAADPDAITQPLDIHVWVDGRRSYGFRTGTHARPDVLAAVGAPNAGFVGIVPPQGPGPHQICAWAINIGPTGTNSLLGCKKYG